MTTTKVLATIGTGPLAPVLALSGPTMRAYAERHGYDFIEGDGEAQGRPPAWAKVLLLRRLLDTYETVLWVDADAIILDPSRDIADELVEGDYQALVCHRLPSDWRGYFGNPGDEMPNSGVWLLRGQRGRDFLDAVWERDEFVDHQWWENAAVITLLGYGLGPCRHVEDTVWTEGTRWVDDEWNSHTMFTGLAPARIRHYAGVGNVTRARRMRADLGQSPIPKPVWAAYWRLQMRGLAPARVGARTIKRAIRA